jgi:catechol 2,3-dioxygenase-like lactoylglutathione lyase family enzyme
MITSDEGNTKSALFQGQPPQERSTAGFHRVAFRVGAGDFMEFINQVSLLGLRDQDGELVTPDMIVDHGKSFSIYFSDPYGHRLEVTTYE